MNDVISVLMPVIEGLAGQYGVVAQVLLWMASLRLVFKPTMTYIQTIVDATPTQKDNEMLTSLMNSVPYKVVTFLIDLTTSIKLPEAK